MRHDETNERNWRPKTKTQEANGKKKEKFKSTTKNTRNRDAKIRAKNDLGSKVAAQ